ncbi:bifunctional tetrahydrofolate synthase/dihydrofolate synthase, partial [Vibrio parahaemolyticus]|nr:bifunctional tetrahydrofolate synthase/dihydrofolate synthase [Vibrio parahaemolyticus]
IVSEFFLVCIKFEFAVSEIVWMWSCCAFALVDIPLRSLPLDIGSTSFFAVGEWDLKFTYINIVNVLIYSRMGGGI